MPKIARFYPIYALFAGLMLAFSTCSYGPGDNPVSGRKNTMVIRLNSDPLGLNPVNTVGAKASAIHNLLFEHLIALHPKTLKLVPQLAAEMPAISADKLRFTFTLRDDIHFADGKPVTAQDVLFSFKALMNPYVDSAPKRAELQRFIDCKIIDQKTVEFTLSESGPLNLNRFAINFFVLPKHIYDPQSLSDAYSARAGTYACEFPDSIPEADESTMKAFAAGFEQEKHQRERGFVMGSGRYVFDNWGTGQSIRLVKNQEYWNSGASNVFSAQKMDTLLYKVIPDNGTALQALRSGEIDFADDFEAHQFAGKMSEKAFETHFAKKSIPYPFYEYVGWNTRIKDQPQKTFFADKNVRMAMSHLIDVEEIISHLLNGTAAPITSMVYVDRDEYNDELVPIRYSPTKAGELLAEAGWKDSDGDGIRDKMVHGQSVKFEFDLHFKRGNELRKRIARHIKDKCKKEGIIVNVHETDWNVMYSDLESHKLDAWLGGWVYDSDEQDLYSLFHSTQALNKGYNWGSYFNLEADSIMEAIVVEWDDEKRKVLHKQIQQILYDDQPYTLLFANAARIAYNRRLQTDVWFGQRPCYDPGQFYVTNKGE